jgi:hypothetical protein
METEQVQPPILAVAEEAEPLLVALYRAATVVPEL